MSEFIKTLFEEKEKLDEICHIEEQQRKKIQKQMAIYIQQLVSLLYPL